MKLLRAILLLCLFASGVFSNAAFSGSAPPLVLDTLRQGASLSETGHLLWLADATDTLDIDAVRAPDNATRFVAAPHPPRPEDRLHP